MTTKKSQTPAKAATGKKSVLRRPMLLVMAGLALLGAAAGLAWTNYEGKSDHLPLSVAAPAIQRPTTDGYAALTVPQEDTQGQGHEPAAAMAVTGEASFDIVRIDPEGNTVIAGRAPTDSIVAIMDGGQEIGRVKADVRGEWVFLPDQPLPAGARELTLKATDRNGHDIPSRDVVILVVPEQKGERTLAVRSDRKTGESTLLQGAAPLSAGSLLSIDTIDYDKNGSLAVSGRISGPGTIRLYLNNAPAGEVSSTESGIWRIRPEQRAVLGNHTLRADFLNEKGTVKARVELPFQRIELESMPEGRRIIVQEGNSLWRLARRAYGDGLAYTVIYDANRGQIQDPDLIYPGQVFVVPSGQSKES